MTKLVNKETGEAIRVGDIVKNVRGEEVCVERWIVPHYGGGADGIVMVVDSTDTIRQCTPSDIDAKIVD